MAPPLTTACPMIDRAGKTNILERLKSMFAQVVGLDPGKILPTVGLNVGRLEAYGHSLVIWDLGGQAGLQGIWDKYYAESHAVIYVVDSGERRANRPKPSYTSRLMPYLPSDHWDLRASLSEWVKVCRV